jgi:PST family polysaccharide transporter
VKEIAEARASNDWRRVLSLKRSLLGITMLSGSAVAILVFSLRKNIATTILGDPAVAGSVGWIALGVGLMTVTNALSAWLNGFRKINEITKVNIWNATLSVIASTAAVYWWGMRGVVVVVLSQPVATLIGSWFYVRRTQVPAASSVQADRRDSIGTAKALLGLGIVTMAVTLANSGSDLAARSIINRQLGTAAVGHYHAAATLAVQYLVFFFVASTLDYFPRLAELGENKRQIVATINEQIEAAILLTVPLILGVYVFAPKLITLLYSNKFGESASLLRWLVLGDLIRVPGYVMGYCFYVLRDKRFLLGSELFLRALFLVSLVVLLPEMGLQAAGAAFVVSNLAYILLVYFVLRRVIRFRISQRNSLLFISAAGSAAAMLTLGSEAASWVARLMIVSAWSCFSVTQIYRQFAWGGVESTAA